MSIEFSQKNFQNYYSKKVVWNPRQILRNFSAIFLEYTETVAQRNSIKALLQDISQNSQ